MAHIEVLAIAAAPDHFIFLKIIADEKSAVILYERELSFIDNHLGSSCSKIQKVFYCLIFVCPRLACSRIVLHVLPEGCFIEVVS